MPETEETLSIMEFIKELMTNAGLRAWFTDEPEAALEHYGLQDLSPQDVNDALVLIDDSQTADFSRDYDGNNKIDWTAPNWGSGDHDGGHKEAVEHLSSFITNNFVADNDTTVDNSVNQQIDTGGGDFDQDIDIDSAVASGDGAVAAGDDILDSTITTGDDNQVGDGNVSGDGNVVGDDNGIVSGDGNTAAFGAGDANSATFDDVTVNKGGALSVGGDANGDFDATDSFNTTETTNTTSFDVDDSFNQDNDVSTEIDNETTTRSDVDSHDRSEEHVASDNHVEVN